MTPVQTRLLFTTAALFNFSAVVLLSSLTPLPQMLGLIGAGVGLFDHIALLAIAGFGYGYWLVAQAPAEHRTVVVLGFLLKLGVVILAVVHFLAGTLNLSTLALISVDLIYALLFYCHLRQPASVYS